MSRIRRALAATTMAVAAAGGGLLLAAAAAVPAYASAPAVPAPPPGSQTFTMTGHLTQQAAGGIRPFLDDDPRPRVIICWITVNVPFVYLYQTIYADVRVHCDHPVDAIRLDETLSENNTEVSTDSDDKWNDTDAFTATAAGPCQTIEYENFGFAGIDFPEDYTPREGSVHGLESFVPTAMACTPPPPGGPGGGGGGPVGPCAIHAPASSARQAAIRPHVHTC